MKANKFKNKKPEQDKRTHNHPPKKQPGKDVYFDIAGLAIIILLGIIIYSNSFNCSFQFDDVTSIVSNPHIRNLPDVKEIWNFSKSRFVPYYTLAFNYYFSHLTVWGYHLFNLVIHLINGCLVWWITLLIFCSPALKENPVTKHRKIIAFFTALLFVSHPLATQSVTYIIQRMASMAAMFYFLSIALYANARLLDKSNTLKYFLFGGFFISAILAMLTKENTVTLPFAILLFEIFFLRTKRLSFNMKDYRIILVMAAFLGFILIVLLRYSLSIFKPLPPDLYNDFQTVTSFNYLLTQLSVIVKYIGLLFLPVNQNLDYEFQLSDNLFEPRTLLSLFMILLLLAVAIFLFKRYRIVSFGISWFFLTLSIESSFIPVSDLVVEHRTYLPSYGFFLILTTVIFVFFWNKYKYIAITIFVIIVLSNSYLSYERNKVWKNELSLWSDVVSKSPHKARPIAYRGLLLYNEKNYRQALEDFNKAIELKPLIWQAFYNRALILMNEKRYEEALNDFNKTIILNPNNAEAYLNRGALLETEKKYKLAIEDYSKAIRLKPKLYYAYYNRANILKNENHIAQALEDYNKAIELNNKYTEGYVNRANLFRGIACYEEAIRDYEKAIELKPDFSPAFYNYGILLMMEKKFTEATGKFTKIIELKTTDVIEAYYNRGTAKYFTGNKETGCMDLQEAAKSGYQPAVVFIKQFCH